MAQQLEIKSWQGRPLADLWPELTAEAQVAGGAWVARALPSGATVFLRDAGGRKTLRIARGERPKTDKGATLFARECGTFLRAFGIEGWIPEEEPGARGIARRYHEPTPRPTCPSCDYPMDDGALLAGADVCSACGLRDQTSGKRLVQCAGYPGFACSELIPHDPVYGKENRCNNCAGGYGRWYAEQLRARKEAAHE